ncbi:MAG: calcium:proton antiporter, partial [Calditrichales bacterium]
MAKTTSVFKSEAGLIIIALTTLIMFIFGSEWLTGSPTSGMITALFIWLFVIMLWASFAVVRHADALAVLLGEPYGTLVLTLAVISIEVVMVSAIMVTGVDNPTLGRDMIFSVLMIVLNGLIGFSLLLGGLRHREQDYNLRGANTYISVLIPLAVLGLILPAQITNRDGGGLSTFYSIFLITMTIGLYIVFLIVQTIRHQDYFICRVAETESESEVDSHAHHGIVIRSLPFHLVFLFAYMLPIILLSKKMAVLIDLGITAAGAPIALSGFLVAILVLSPEGLAAVNAALEDRIQRSINIGLGSALATIGLTIPAVLTIGMIT